MSNDETTNTNEGTPSIPEKPVNETTAKKPAAKKAPVKTEPKTEKPKVQGWLVS